MRDIAGMADQPDYNTPPELNADAHFILSQLFATLTESRLAVIKSAKQLKSPHDRNFYKGWTSGLKFAQDAICALVGKDDDEG